MRPIDLARRFRDLPRWIVGGVLALFVAVGVLAFRPEARQALPSTLLPTPSSTLPPPIPSDVQQDIKFDLQHLKLIQTEMVVLQNEFDTTKAGLQTKLRAVSKPGYDIDLQTFPYQYVPLAQAPAKK